MKLLNFF